MDFNTKNFYYGSVSLVFSFLTLFTNFEMITLAPDSNKSLLKGIYWEVKPYIFTNDQGKVDGIIPTMFERARHFCVQDKQMSLIRFTNRFSSRNAFHEQLQRPELVYGQGVLKGVQHEEAFWAPVISFLDLDWESEHHVRSFQLLKSKFIAVIVPRHYIDLPSKLLRGIASCGPIFVIAILLAILFSMVVWAIEHRDNDTFPRSFVRGSLKGFWWSCVSMTTVGYGDTVPRSLIGRFVALWWLFIGVMVGCVMTATVTNIVSNVDDLSIYGKTVAVLQNSYESKVAALNYEAIVVPVASYEDVFEYVRHNKAFAGLINADVAAWYQKEIQEHVNHTALHIVKKLPANLYMKCLMSTNLSREMRKIINCMYRFREEIYTQAEEHFQKYCHMETLHVGSIAELCMTDFFIQMLFGLVGLGVTLGCLYDTLPTIHRKLCKTKNACDREEEGQVTSCKHLLVISSKENESING